MNSERKVIAATNTTCFGVSNDETPTNICVHVYDDDSEDIAVCPEERIVTNESEKEVRYCRNSGDLNPCKYPVSPLPRK